MRIYLDICCYNRPFDDQSHLRIRLEAEAKLKIQEDVRAGRFDLLWSYILSYENSKNPFPEKRKPISQWQEYAVTDTQEDREVLGIAVKVQGHGIKKLDSLHIACAIKAEAEFFLTTDDVLLKKSSLIPELRITDPIGFIKEVLT